MFNENINCINSKKNLVALYDTLGEGRNWVLLLSLILQAFPLSLGVSSVTKRLYFTSQFNMVLSMGSKALALTVKGSNHNPKRKNKIKYKT